MKCASILSLATISMGSAHVFAQEEPRFPSGYLGATPSWWPSRDDGSGAAIGGDD
jgi:hypothetical protein